MPHFFQCNANEESFCCADSDEISPWKWRNLSPKGSFFLMIPRFLSASSLIFLYCITLDLWPLLSIPGLIGKCSCPIKDSVKMHPWMIRSHTISSDLWCLVIDMNNNKIEFQPEKGQTIPFRYRHLPKKTYDFLKPDFCFFYPKNLSRSLLLPCFDFFLHC